MNSFYLSLWARWVLRITLCSTLLALVGAFFITSVIYAQQGFPTLTEEVIFALVDIAKFWFPLTWSITLLVVLFRSIKYIFNVQTRGYVLRLLDCSSTNILYNIGYGDLVKVWRKWFMVMIWLIGTQMLLSLVFTNLFTTYTGVFEWFNIYFLFLYTLIAGYFSIVLLAGRCKNVKVVKC